MCEGAPEPPAGTVDAPLGPREGSLVEQCVRPDGKPARTRYETIRQAEAVSLLRLKLETGRTHQIRVHLAWLGHPLVGDFLYGREDPGLIRRPALHSAELSFRHPITGKRLSFSQPLRKIWRPFWRASTIRRSFLPLNISTQWRPGGLSPV